MDRLGLGIQESLSRIIYNSKVFVLSLPEEIKKCRVIKQPFDERRFYIHDIFSDKEITEKSNTLSQMQSPANRQVQMRGVAFYRAIGTNFWHWAILIIRRNP